jgi:hypothetical protein
MIPGFPKKHHESGGILFGVADEKNKHYEQFIQRFTLRRSSLEMGRGMPRHHRCIRYCMDDAGNVQLNTNFINRRKAIGRLPFFVCGNSVFLM